MKKLILSGVVAIGLVSLLTGCSDKIPEPEQVKWDNNSAITINKNLLFTKDFKVPKDPYLKNVNWTYQITATKTQNELFSNEQIVKTFLVAQNAQEIILIGRADLINEYKNYFLNNGVTAIVKEQPVKPIIDDFNTVNILFFNKVEK